MFITVATFSFSLDSCYLIPSAICAMRGVYNFSSVSCIVWFTTSCIVGSYSIILNDSSYSGSIFYAILYFWDHNLLISNCCFLFFNHRNHTIFYWNNAYCFFYFPFLLLLILQCLLYSNKNPLSTRSRILHFPHKYLHTFPLKYWCLLQLQWFVSFSMLILPAGCSMRFSLLYQWPSHGNLGWIYWYLLLCHQVKFLLLLALLV